MVKPAAQAKGRGGAAPGQKPVLLGFGRWLLVLLILLAFARAVWALGDKSLWWDESLSLHRTQRTLAYTLSNQIILTDNVGEVVTIDNHPPLYFLLLWVATRLFGQSEFALRFLSLAAVVSIVPLLYVTGRQIVDERAGLAAAALAALSPMYLWYGQEARMYALVALLSLLSFYLFFRTFFGSPEPLNKRGWWRWGAAYVLASICLIFTHYLGALLIAFQMVALGLVGLRRADLRKALMLTIAAVLSISLISLGYAWFTRPSIPRRPGFDFLPLPDLLRDLLNSFSLGLSVDVGDWYVLAIDLVFLLCLVVGLVWLVRPAASRQGRTAGWLLAGYLFLPIVLIYALSFVFPVYMNSRHLIVISPAFYLLVGAGLTRWRGRVAWVLVPVALLMIAGMSYSTYNYFVDPDYDKDHHREWGAYLRQQVRPGDVVVVNPPHIADLYEYYASSTVPWLGLPLLGEPRQATEAKLGELLEEYDRVWLALSSTPPWGDRQRIVETWLNENAFRAARESFKSYAARVVVALYLPGWPSVPHLPDDARLLDVRFTPQLRLAGYRLASPAESGKPLHVEVFWAVDEYIPEQASVLLRLVDEEGHLWGEGEQCPFNELYPMWQWQPGLLLRDEYEVSISPGTPPGEYQLELGLVSRPTEDGCSGAAGPLVTPLSAPPGMHRGDRVLLGTVDVQRPAERPDWEALGIEGQRRVRFDGLDLLGAEVTPSALKAGERLHLTLYWQAQRSLPGDERFRLRLVDPAGVTQQEAVIRPAGEGRPAGGWLAGDRFRGQFWLLLPEEMPEGRYRLELLPEPPLQRTGAWATVRRWLGAGEAGVDLGSVDVEALAFHQPSVPVPLPTDLVLAHPLLATLGDRVRFLGYELESDSVLAGETVSVTLYWQALGPMDFDYSVFTHLLGPANEVLAQDDGTPRDGTRPTTLWEPGEVIADPYRLVVGPDVPPGRYPLEIGMYRLETGTRLPVVDAGGQPVPHDRILLTAITVLPVPTTP